MHKIHKQHQAEQDLIGIWIYSCGNWGINQADAYLDQLDEAFKIIANNPEIGINIDTVRPGYHKYPYKEHVIFYTTHNSTINIVRVLGNEMDYIQCI
ncbi:MAG: type II toxin-antitoxin system RelE/ParE family toxin [Proteobacteria bacterium]|nr:type II toxin-antitoxin system RelE/ParE family toxin [Pseudomonadota bacterium]